MSIWRLFVDTLFYSAAMVLAQYWFGIRPLEFLAIVTFAKVMILSHDVKNLQ